MKVVMMVIGLMVANACFGQDRPQVVIDSIYGVAYPYKKQIQTLKTIKGVSVSIIRITEESSNKSVARVRLIITDFLAAGSNNSEIIALSPDDVDYLVSRLSHYYVLGNTDAPRNYEEHTDILGSLGNRVKLSLFSSENTGKWTFKLIAVRPVRKDVMCHLQINDLPELAKLFKQASNMVKAM
ncbi:hypothetical protein [Neolewinella antarctica]|uniref:Uncharacterized protein n=1 Tax=Neolewinella antarctica TaxID=442734 RepID=A0ABX0X751_9BACT|nr:hypothetical protein [Neolewinella antarctica]NJC24824.1 hypothetical protein [Neolewinella antarctica]